VMAGASAASSSSASSSSGTATVQWTVSSVRAAVGDRVTKGQLLARASTDDLEAQIQAAQRAVSSATLQLALSQTAVDDAATTAQRRQAEIGRYGAQSQLAQAQQTLADLEAMRAWSTIAAPVDGTVTSVAIQAGASAPSGAAIVVQAATLEVVGNVVESDVPSLAVGQAAAVTIDALGLAVSGTVSAIAPNAASSGTAGSGGSGVVTFAVTVTLGSPPQGARAGMSAHVSITVARAANVLAIPTAALGGTAGSYRVGVLGANGQVENRSVAVGLITSSLAEITSGLSEGETVVTGTSAQRNGTGGAVFGAPGGGFRQVTQGKP
jgi:RND family efflux transporter MFP subunit